MKRWSVGRPSPCHSPLTHLPTILFSLRYPRPSHQSHLSRSSKVTRTLVLRPLSISSYIPLSGHCTVHVSPRLAADGRPHPGVVKTRGFPRPPDKMSDIYWRGFPHRVPMGQLSVLIVEDEAILAAHLASKIKLLGYHVIGPVSTGEKTHSASLKRRGRRFSISGLPATWTALRPQSA